MEADALILLVLIVIAAILAFSRDSARTAPVPAGTVSELQEVKVQYIIDGDTVIVSKSRAEIRIRLAAIDCPEDGQHWGDIAKAGLITLIGGRHVYIEAHGVDDYGRILATIYVDDRGSELINVNERMVMLGHAWVMRKYYGHLPKSRQHQLNKLESWARAKRVGLWKTSNPIPPWEWRKQG